MVYFPQLFFLVTGRAHTHFVDVVNDLISAFKWVACSPPDRSPHWCFKHRIQSSNSSSIAGAAGHSDKTSHESIRNVPVIRCLETLAMSER